MSCLQNFMKMGKSLEVADSHWNDSLEYLVAFVLCDKRVRNFNSRLLCLWPNERVCRAGGWLRSAKMDIEVLAVTNPINILQRKFDATLLVENFSIHLKCLIKLRSVKFML